MSRSYTTRRQQIVAALVTKLKTINGSGVGADTFLTDINDNVVGRLLFWDEVDEFPAIHVNAGRETREYRGAGIRDRFLSITLRCYVRQEDAAVGLDRLLEDVETVIENNSSLAYVDKQGTSQNVQQITIASIDTDEGVLEPLGVGEMLIEVRY